VPDLALTIHNDQELPVDLHGVDELARHVWQTEASQDGEISIILVDDKKLTEINVRFLERDYRTDVIAFPLSDADDDVFEGEIYISVERVIENAAIFQVKPYHELRRVVVHALLHFLGYSDKEVVLKQKMTERENFYLEQFFLLTNKL